MTIICYRDGVMASDSGAWQGDALVGDRARKLWKVRGHLFGVLGDRGVTLDAIEKFRATGKLVADKIGPDDGVMVATPDGRFLNMSRSVIEDMTEYPFFADGSLARMVALGAFHHGATAVQACRVAMKVGPWTAGKMQVIRL